MEPPQRQTSPPSPPRPTAVHESASLPTAALVAVVFKKRRDDADAHTTWCVAPLAEVAVVNGRLQLLREGYGVAFDVPSRSMIEHDPRVMRAIRWRRVVHLTLDRVKASYCP